MIETKRGGRTFYSPGTELCGTASGLYKPFGSLYT